MSDLSNETNTENNVPEAEKGAFDAQGMLFQNRIKGDSRKKRIVGALAVLLMLAAAGYGYSQWFGKSDSTEYSTTTISRAAVTDYVEATGTLSAIKQSAMGFKNDDTITAINVQAGDEVKAGQILAQQDPANLQATLQQAMSTVEQDEISIKTAELSYETNKKTLNRQQKLFDAGALAQSELDTAKDNFTKSEWEVATAKSKLKNDQTKVTQAQSDVSACTLAAPFDGIIGAVNGQVGQINGINSSSSTLLTIMSRDLELTALVNEADIGRIKLGQDVEFSSSSYNNKTFKGKVRRITPQASTVSNVQYYPVLISCDDPERKLLSGMSVTAKIIIAQKKDVLTVPMMAVSFAQTFIKEQAAAGNKTPAETAKTNADDNNRAARISANKQQTSGLKATSAAGHAQAGITKRESEPSNQTSFIVLLKDGKPTVSQVILGLSDGSNYEVLQGLNEGDQVIVGSNQLSNQTDNTDTKTNSNSNKTQQNRGMGGSPGMGGPPPGM